MRARSSLGRSERLSLSVPSVFASPASRARGPAHAQGSPGAAQYASRDPRAARAADLADLRRTGCRHRRRMKWPNPSPRRAPRPRSPVLAPPLPPSRAALPSRARRRSAPVDRKAASEVRRQAGVRAALVESASTIAGRMTCLDPDAAPAALGGAAGRKAGKGVVEPDIEPGTAHVTGGAIFWTVAGDADHAAAHTVRVVVAKRGCVRPVGEDAPEVAC